MKSSGERRNDAPRCIGCGAQHDGRSELAAGDGKDRGWGFVVRAIVGVLNLRSLFMGMASELRLRKARRDKLRLSRWRVNVSVSV